MPEIMTDDGVRLHYRIEDFREPWATDDRPTVLLHHGFAKNLEFWTPFVPSVARRYRTVRFDARGHGKSSEPSPSSTWSLDRLVSDALELIDMLGLTKIHWVSFESGGVVGLAFATAHAERMASLSMFNTPSGTWMTSGRMRNYFECGYPHMYDALDALGFETWITKTLPIWIDPDSDQAAIDWVRRQSASTPIPVAKAWYQVMEGSDISDLPNRVRAPTLLVAGAEHTFGCEPPHLDRLREMLPNARQVIYIPGVASAVQLMAPDASAAELLKFLRDIDE